MGSKRRPKNYLLKILSRLYIDLKPHLYVIFFSSFVRITRWTEPELIIPNNLTTHNDHRIQKFDRHRYHGNTLPHLNHVFRPCKKLNNHSHSKKSDRLMKH